jgi:hypothetical protein
MESSVDKKELVGYEQGVSEVLNFCIGDLRSEEGNHGVQFPGLGITGENFSVK